MFPIDVARRAMQIEEVSIVHVYFCIEILIHASLTGSTPLILQNLKAKKSLVQPLVCTLVTGSFNLRFLTSTIPLKFIMNVVSKLQMMVSSTTGAGIRSLRTVLTNIARLVRR